MISSRLTDNPKGFIINNNPGAHNVYSGVHG